MPRLQAVDDDNGNAKVAEVMDSWTKQTGYPVVTINTNNGVINQKHFLFNDSSESRYVLNGHCSGQFSVWLTAPNCARLQVHTFILSWMFKKGIIFFSYCPFLWHPYVLKANRFTSLAVMLTMGLMSYFVPTNISMRKHTYKWYILISYHCRDMRL